MEEDEIKVLFQHAIDVLVEEYPHLLRNNANERAIGARLAQIMQPLFPDHDVDTDYNRRGDQPDLQKVLNLPHECQGAPGMGIAPDIIVHEPFHDERNLLVVEIKKTMNRQDRHCDRVRLAAMRQQLGYRAAAFVEFATGRHFGERGTVVEWIETPA